MHDDIFSRSYQQDRIDRVREHCSVLGGPRRVCCWRWRLDAFYICRRGQIPYLRMLISENTFKEEESTAFSTLGTQQRQHHLLDEMRFIASNFTFLFLFLFSSFRLENSFLKESSLFKPGELLSFRFLFIKLVLISSNTHSSGLALFSLVFGDAGRMGKVLTGSPELATPTMQGGFQGDINAVLKLSPEGINGPFSILKKYVR